MTRCSADPQRRDRTAAANPESPEPDSETRSEGVPMNLLLQLIHDRRRRARGDAGYSTETVLVIALLAVMAVTAVGFISSAVLERASSFTLG